MASDVVVVGCGVAGLSAALSAAQEGAKVVLLERSPLEERGGNSRYTEAYLRMTSETQISDDFEDRLANSSVGTIDPALLKQTMRPYAEWPPILKAYGFTDPELITSFAESVPETIAWLKACGIKFLEAKPFSTQVQVTVRLAPVGGGEAVVETLVGEAEKAGVIFNYETTALSLILNEKGDVRGMRAWSNAEGNKKFDCNAVILASGGFQGNLEMMTRYVGRHSHLTRPVAPGGLYNKGEGIEMALKIGAAPAGQYDAFHAEPVDPRSGKPEALVGIFIYGILVNRKGERFIDEGSNLYELIYEETSREILKQDDGVVYFISDSKIEEVPNYERRIKTEKEPIKGKSIAELSLKLSIDLIPLERTIRNYNASIQEGHFDPSILDGKCTIGIEPPKSNWARTINETDLVAFPVACANCFTFGGLKITPNAEVLNQDGYFIPGLYAAGEAIGLYYGSYVGSTSVLRGLVFGRKAGKHAAAYCKRTSE